MTTADAGSVTVSYSYDALGQRITSSGGQFGSVVQLYDAAGQVIETDISDASGSVVSQYVWGIGYVNDLVERNDNTSSSSGVLTLNRAIYSMRDANHNVIAIASNTDGNVLQWFGYGAYGTQCVFRSAYASTTDGYNWEIGFQGGMKDPNTGLIHFQARDLNTATGTWMTQEPFGAAYVNGANLYQAFNSDPARTVDPSGLQPFYPDYFRNWWDILARRQDGILVLKDYLKNVHDKVTKGIPGADASMTCEQLHTTLARQELALLTREIV